MKPKISKHFSQTAFTLIELLVVISIIAALSALVVAALAAGKKSSYRKTAKAELTFVEAAIENYKTKYGSYPPSNKHAATATYDPSILNPLYYELSGVINTTPPPSLANFKTLDGSTKISEADYQAAFGMGAIVNVSRGSGDDGVSAQNFLTGLKAKQFDNNVLNNSIVTTVLITSVGGPDANGLPPNFYSNPIHYNSVNPTNNPGAYDLWIDLVISGKPYRIGNWTAK